MLTAWIYRNMGRENLRLFSASISDVVGLLKVVSVDDFQHNRQSYLAAAEGRLRLPLAMFRVTLFCVNYSGLSLSATTAPMNFWQLLHVQMTLCGQHRRACAHLPTRSAQGAT